MPSFRGLPLLSMRLKSPVPSWAQYDPSEFAERVDLGRAKLRSGIAQA